VDTNCVLEMSPLSPYLHSHTVTLHDFPCIRSYIVDAYNQFISIQVSDHFAITLVSFTVLGEHPLQWLEVGMVHLDVIFA